MRREAMRKHGLGKCFDWANPAQKYLGVTATLLLKTRRPLNVIHGSARFPKFNRARGNSGPGNRPGYVRGYQPQVTSPLIRGHGLAHAAQIGNPRLFVVS
jgi:hypothetical protein